MQRFRMLRILVFSGVAAVSCYTPLRSPVAPVALELPGVSHVELSLKRCRATGSVAATLAGVALHCPTMMLSLKGRRQPNQKLSCFLCELDLTRCLGGIPPDFRPQRALSTCETLGLTGTPHEVHGVFRQKFCGRTSCLSQQSPHITILRHCSKL